MGYLCHNFFFEHKPPITYNLIHHSCIWVSRVEIWSKTSPSKNRDKEEIRTSSLCSMCLYYEGNLSLCKGSLYHCKDDSIIWLKVEYDVYQKYRSRYAGILSIESFSMYEKFHTQLFLQNQISNPNEWNITSQRWTYRPNLVIRPLW